MYMATPLSATGKAFDSGIDDKVLQLHELDGIDPDLIEAEHKTVLWLGSKGVTTPLHIDLMHNFFYQVSTTPIPI